MKVFVKWFLNLTSLIQMYVSTDKHNSHLALTYLFIKRRRGGRLRAKDLLVYGVMVDIEYMKYIAALILLE